MLSSAVIQILENSIGSVDELRLKNICEGVLTLSHLFTKQGDQRGDVYLESPELLKAYLAYFLPVNLGKVQSLLDEQAGSPPMNSRSPQGFRFLDVGSGPGTATLAIIDWLIRRSPDCEFPIEGRLLDESPMALGQAEKLLRRSRQFLPGASFSIKTCRVNLEKKNFMRRVEQEGGMNFDLIFIGNSLNELFLGRSDALRRKANLIKSLWPTLSPEGSLVIMEPALRNHARDLHQLRDMILKEKLATVYSPCLHEANCPALPNPKDWCHEERPWSPPPLVSEIDSRVGFEKDTLKFSYLILRKDGRTVVQREESLLRVVSELFHHKGEKRVWVCQESGRSQIGRLDRERSETNGTFDNLHRGAIAKVDPIVRKEKDGQEYGLGRVTSTGSITVVRGIKEP